MPIKRQIFFPPFHSQFLLFASLAPSFFFSSCLKYHLLRHVSLNYSTQSRFSMLLFAILSVSFIACITNHKDFICLNLIVPFFLGKENCMGNRHCREQEAQSMMIRKNAYPHHQEKSEMLFTRLAKI